MRNFNSDLAEDIRWTFKLYAFVFVLPIVLSFMNILFVGIFGIQTDQSFWYNFKTIWIDYFFTGTLFSIAAWRIHLGLLFISFLINKF